MGALPETEKDGSERRVAPRMRVLKRAKVVFNGGFSTIDCIVRNISSTGALLTVDEAVHLPKQFQILIGEGEEERPAKLVYRRSMFAGIRFLDIPSEDDVGPVGVAARTRLEPVAGGGGAGAAETPTIRRIVPERLPHGLTRHLAWNRRG